MKMTAAQLAQMQVSTLRLHAFHNGEWERKCERCFGRLGFYDKTENAWGCVIQPTDTAQRVPTEEPA